MSSATSSFDALAGRLRRAVANRVRIDTRTLAAFRVLAGLLIIADLLLRSRNFSFYYTNDGAVPQSLAQAMSSEGAISIYHYTTDPTVIAGLFVLQGLIAVQLIVGYKTRIATILSFLLVVSLDHHNPLVLSYADTLFRLLLFWAIFLPLGERWSIDAVHADREPRKGIASVASALILAQMVVMYIVNGYHKAHDELWTSGEATPLIMGLHDTTFFLAPYLREFQTLLQIGGLTWFYMLLFSWLLFVLRGRLRMALVGMFVASHASFIVTVRIGAFPYVAIAGVMLFLQAQFWDDLKAVARYLGVDLDAIDARRERLAGLARRVPDVRLRGERQRRARELGYNAAIGVVVLSIVLFVALSMLPIGGVADEETVVEEQIEDRAQQLSIDQPDWSVFAPTPRTTDSYYVFPAQTADGEVVDVYNGQSSVSYDRPYEGSQIQEQYGSYRERFYMNSVRRGGMQGTNDADDSLAEYICTSWEEEQGTELTHVNMYRVSEDVTMDTVSDPDDRDRSVDLVSAHGCGDNEPAEIQPPDF
ncbi:HTTM domain-containing protein [Natronococcus occultus]|uniref:Vitamin K-dependent gamma-carboxylase n=1 Tax=Natronococcus occultus SP4 TaxID=694430 RepID=L0K6F6_9EURY|nr:HTTM domain-containing protein [Natronococcus occultus]AGB39718.1 Vitamin K-dependent gamma-carboxylase [Natronococcus occultus SP4]